MSPSIDDGSDDKDDRIIDMAADFLGMEELDNLVTSWLRRSGGIARLLLSVSGTQAGSSVRRLLATSDRAQALTIKDLERLSGDIVNVLGRYKGAMMKVGQMLSYLDLIDLPESARAVLAQLQVASPPMAPKVITKVFQDELGAEPQQLFARWSPKPFAAASIGQVHKAEFPDGTKLAVKIQYPGVEKAMMNDLKSASILATIMQPFSGEIDTKATSQEIRQRMLEECDYRIEAEQQQRFRAFFEDDAEIVIPRVFNEYVTKRVLTTEFFRAQSLQTIAKQASKARRDAAGRTIFRMVFTSIFKHHCFNCDPHPGNYLFGRDNVVFLDFGCIKSFEPDFVERWRGLMRSIIENNAHAHRTFLDALHISPEPNRRTTFDYEYQMQVSRYLYRPWLTDQPFRYTSEYVKESFAVLVSRNPNASHIRLPPEFVFVNRLQWGLNSVLAALGAETRWREVLLPLLYSPDEKWPEPLSDGMLHETL